MNASLPPFRRELIHFQRQHPLFQETHPFWRDCFRGRLSVADLRRWACDVYPIVRDFSQLYLQVAAKCTDERVLTFLAETIFEETGSGREGDSHPTLFRQFMQSIGIAPDEIPCMSGTPAGREFLDFAWSTVRQRSFVAGLALVGIGVERPLPAFFQMICRVFQRDLGLSDQAVRFFAVHTVADVKHSQLAARIVSEWATSAAEQAEVRAVLESVWSRQLAQLDQLQAARTTPVPVSDGELSPVASRRNSR